MHRSRWQDDLAETAAVARDAAIRATEAQGLRPCLQCGEPATVWLSIPDMRFSAGRCDRCALEVLQFAAIRKAGVSLDRYGLSVGRDVIEGIDVPQLAIAVLDCAVGDHAIESVQDGAGAASALDTVLSAKLGRALLPSEQATTRYVVIRAMQDRRTEAKAQLAETQAALYRPLMYVQRRTA